MRGLVRGNPSPSLERARRYLGGGETSFRSQQDSRKSYGTPSGPTSQPGCGYTVKVRMELDGVWWPQSMVWALWGGGPLWWQRTCCECLTGMYPQSWLHSEGPRFTPGSVLPLPVCVPIPSCSLGSWLVSSRRCERHVGGMSGAWWRWTAAGSRSMTSRWRRPWRNCGASMRSK